MTEMKANGTQKMSPKIFDALLQFVDERLDKPHRPDPELAAAHNADPKNADWKIDPGAPFEQAGVVHDLLAFLAERMIALNKQRQKKVKTFLAWLEAELEIAPDAKGREGIEALTGKIRLKDFLGDYQKGEDALTFDNLWEILRKNKRRIGRSLTPTFMEVFAPPMSTALPNSFLSRKPSASPTDSSTKSSIACTASPKRRSPLSKKSDLRSDPT